MRAVTAKWIWFFPLVSMCDSENNKEPTQRHWSSLCLIEPWNLTLRRSIFVTISVNIITTITIHGDICAWCARRHRIGIIRGVWIHIAISRFVDIPMITTESEPFLATSVDSIWTARCIRTPLTLKSAHSLTQTLVARLHLVTSGARLEQNGRLVAHKRVRQTDAMILVNSFTSDNCKGKGESTNQNQGGRAMEERLRTYRKSSGPLCRHRRDPLWRGARCLRWGRSRKGSLCKQTQYPHCGGGSLGRWMAACRPANAQIYPRRRRNRQRRLGSTDFLNGRDSTQRQKNRLKMNLELLWAQTTIQWAIQTSSWIMFTNSFNYLALKLR